MFNSTAGVLRWNFYVCTEHDLWLRYLVIEDNVQKYSQISWVFSSYQSGYKQRSSASKILFLHISDSVLSHINQYCGFFYAEIRRLRHTFFSESTLSPHISSSLYFLTAFSSSDSQYIHTAPVSLGGLVPQKMWKVLTPTQIHKSKVLTFFDYYGLSPCSKPTFIESLGSERPIGSLSPTIYPCLWPL